MEYVRKDLVHAYLQCERNKALSADVIHGLIEQIPIADVREVIEADGYKHLICPHCLSEFYAKTKAEMFCPDCGKKFFFSEKWGKFQYVGENIEQGNGLP